MRAETFLEKKISGLFRPNLHLTHHDRSIAVRGSRESEHYRFKSTRREEKANKSDVHRELQVVRRYSGENADRRNRIEIAKEGW